MKVTYTLSPGHELKMFPISSRIITSNLMRNTKIEPHFSNSLVSIYYKSNLELPKIEKEIGISSFSTWRRWAQSCIAINNKEYLLNSLKTDIVLYSASLAHFDFIPVIYLLNNGVRVVMGGPSTANLSFDDIRNCMIKYGVKEKFLKNLIVVKGYVGSNTDFYKIVQDWKDTILENDFGNTWNCTDDYLQNVLSIAKKVNNFKGINTTSAWEGNDSAAIIMFNSECWYGKCKFCSYPSLSKLNFTDGYSVEEISQSILTMLKKYDTNQLFFSDDYFSYSRKYKDILKVLRSNDIKISVYSGIHYLMRKDMVKEINENVDFLRIGMESASNFSLSYMNKGYNFNGIKKAVNNMIDGLDRDKKITFSIILDLPNTSEEKILEAYRNLKTIKDKIKSNGFDHFNYTPLLWQVGGRISSNVIDNKFVFKSTHDEQNMSGRYLLFKKFEEMGIINEIYKEYSLPLVRKDENGNKLKSDLFIVPQDLYDDLFKGWGFDDFFC